MENSDRPLDAGKISWAIHSAFPEKEEFIRQWNRLAAAQAHPNIFAGYEWIRTWWGHFGSGKQLFLLSGTHDKHLIALAPMMITTRRLLHLPALRVMEIIGTGGVATRGMGLADRVDFLYAESRPTILAALLDRLFSLNPHFDLLLIRAVPESSPTFEQLKRKSDHYALAHWSIFRSASPYAEIKGSWEDFLATRSAKTRRQWRNSCRRLNKEDCELSCYPENGWSFEKTMRAILAISRQSYKWDEQSALLQSSALLKFYTEFYLRISRKGFFKAHFILVDGQAAAYQVGFLYANRLFAYDAAYDKSRKEIHPGIHLVTQGIRMACDKGLTEYDMMRGDEPYKDRWCTGRRQEIHFAAYHPSLRGKTAFLLFLRLRERMRKNRRIKSVYERISRIRRA